MIGSELHDSLFKLLTNCCTKVTRKKLCLLRITAEVSKHDSMTVSYDGGRKKDRKKERKKERKNKWTNQGVSDQDQLMDQLSRLNQYRSGTFLLFKFLRGFRQKFLYVSNKKKESLCLHAHLKKLKTYF